ncbi:hypothetical protein Taro_053119 [Colocasia esculenta]|uniref:Alkaline/neutral invertase n=1 Tax=Colocasia esculenta TaxID=4460 RepID=A0A843XM40_COLES|nr:hypothetical protein [Colocasia esculenta]
MLTRFVYRIGKVSASLKHVANICWLQTTGSGQSSFRWLRRLLLHVILGPPLSGSDHAWTTAVRLPRDHVSGPPHTISSRVFAIPALCPLEPLDPSIITLLFAVFFFSSFHMNASSTMGVSTMRPCRLLAGCRSAAQLLAARRPPFPRHIPSAGPPRHDHLFVVLPHRRSYSSPSGSLPAGSGGRYYVRFLACRRLDGAPAPLSPGGRAKAGGVVPPNAVSGVRPQSTSVESAVSGEKAFERIYVQQGMAVEPLVFERISEDADVVEEKVGGVPLREEESQGDDLAVAAAGVDVVEEERVKEREMSEMEKEAWRLLDRAVVNYCGSPVGTVAADDPATGGNQLNYDQVFIRDFVPSALAFLMKGEGEIVRNFLLHTLQLQSWEKTVDCYSPGQGLMPASFKVRTVPLDGSNEAFEEILDPDFGESAIGRVAPVDSGLWWIILLRAYGKVTGDYALQERVDVQTGIKLIMNLCLSDGFDMFPTLLVTDGSCMIDRRMGIHGHPLEIQVSHFPFID